MCRPPVDRDYLHHRSPHGTLPPDPSCGGPSPSRPYTPIKRHTASRPTGLTIPIRFATSSHAASSNRVYPHGMHADARLTIVAVRIKPYSLDGLNQKDICSSQRHAGSDQRLRARCRWAAANHSRERPPCPWAMCRSRSTGRVPRCGERVASKWHARRARSARQRPWRGQYRDARAAHGLRRIWAPHPHPVGDPAERGTV